MKCEIPFFFSFVFGLRVTLSEFIALGSSVTLFLEFLFVFCLVYLPRTENQEIKILYNNIFIDFLSICCVFTSQYFLLTLSYFIH